MGTKLPAKVSLEIGPADSAADDCALQVLDTREGRNREACARVDRSVECMIWGS